MTNPPYLHHDTAAVRFWVEVEGQAVGASVSCMALHHRFSPAALDEDPLETYIAHAAEIDAAVRRRVAQGSIEPVMLRAFDLRQAAG